MLSKQLKDLLCVELLTGQARTLPNGQQLISLAASYYYYIKLHYIVLQYIIFGDTFQLDGPVGVISYGESAWIKSSVEDKQLFTTAPPCNYQVIPRSCLTGDQKPSQILMILKCKKKPVPGGEREKREWDGNSCYCLFLPSVRSSCEVCAPAHMV